MTGGDGATDEAIPCMACGRLLRDEESKRLRIGPHCLKRLQTALAPRPRDTRTTTAQPATIPTRAPDQLAFEIWPDDGPALDEDDLWDDEEWSDHAADNPPSPDLRGQGLTTRQLYTLTDIPLTGSYL